MKLIVDAGVQAAARRTENQRSILLLPDGKDGGVHRDLGHIGRDESSGLKSCNARIGAGPEILLVVAKQAPDEIRRKPLGGCIGLIDVAIAKPIEPVIGADPEAPVLIAAEGNDGLTGNALFAVPRTEK